MDDARVGRLIRLLRQRRGWRQVDLGRRAGLSQSTVSAIERGHLDRYTLAALRRVLRALNAAAWLDVRWGSPGDVDRLFDVDHAALVGAWADKHAGGGWEHRIEASFNVYGDRGRVDFLAFHAATGVLEVAECKTGIWDLGETLGKLDTKVRVAPLIASGHGWKVTRIVPVLVVAEGRTARRRVSSQPALFAAFDLRGRRVQAWLNQPTAAATGVLAFLPLPRTHGAGLRRAGQQRVRLKASAPA